MHQTKLVKFKTQLIKTSLNLEHSSIQQIKNLLKFGAQLIKNLLKYETH